jgi:hypothetical protein
LCGAKNCRKTEITSSGTFGEKKEKKKQIPSDHLIDLKKKKKER